MKETILILYDIENDKRRKKISDTLEAYGKRVNYSCFEIFISKSKKNQLILNLQELAHPKLDSIRVYSICKNCIDKSFEICKNNPPFFLENDF